MKRTFLIAWWLLFCWTGLSGAQNQASISPGPLVNNQTQPFVFTSGTVLTVSIADEPAANRVPAALVAPVALPRMAPELALQACHGRSVVQAEMLASYSAITLIRVQLPDTAQSGEYELQKHYTTPRSLAFKALRFSGDNFVKSNVIVRLLQSEVDHVQKDDPELNAITPANYKFSYKGTSELEGRMVHVYQLKPRQKRAGLFKGKIYLDAYTGSLVRAEGRVVKSPSFFVKDIEFVQDYADVNDFTFPVHIHSEAKARLVGRAIVDIYDRDYQPLALPETHSSTPAL